eukprot:gb/GFBE01048033.1/.p1 GENE.gb/GFBE01048033.1/~~gb/GFBE01048033.1/.p1  ORF type:complete len:490 (+),score=128.15 gb/GFBE01048033.1/:1-1470(+)
MSSKEKKPVGKVTKFINSAKTWLPWKVAVKFKEAKCANCSKTAEVYCVDCKKELCKFCTTLLHHPDTKAEKHSLEDIVQKSDGVKPEVKIISPILLDILLVAAAWFLLSGSGIKEDYFQGASYCPGLSRVRWWVAKMDANVFFYWKNDLAQYCDWEDSYWRFFMDTWVRSILTNTDSWILVITSFVKAIFFEEFLRIIVSPILSLFYALLAYLVRACEFTLHRILYERLEDSNHTVTQWLQKLSVIVQKIHFAEKFGITGSKKPAPPTYRRKRPSTDWGEYLKYMWSRRLRLLEFYQAQAVTVLNVLLKGSLAVTALVRVFCILFGGQVFEGLAWCLGFGERAERHRVWFTETTGIQANSSQGYMTDWLASFVGRQVLMGIPIVKSLMGEISVAAADGVWDFVPVILRLWPLLLLVALRLGWWFMVKKQKTKFDVQWKSTYKKEIWGDMSRDNPCGGVAYKELHFSVEHDKNPLAAKPPLSRSMTTISG